MTLLPSDIWQRICDHVSPVDLKNVRFVIRGVAWTNAHRMKLILSQPKREGGKCEIVGCGNPVPSNVVAVTEGKVTHLESLHMWPYCCDHIQKHFFNANIVITHFGSNATSLAVIL